MRFSIKRVDGLKKMDEKEVVLAALADDGYRWDVAISTSQLEKLLLLLAHARERVLPNRIASE